MERKGNIDILDETKDDMSTPSKPIGSSGALKGNIDIIDETPNTHCEKQVTDEHLKTTSGICSEIGIDILDDRKGQLLNSNLENSNDRDDLSSIDETKEKDVKEFSLSDGETEKNSDYCPVEKQLDQTLMEGAFKCQENYESDTTESLTQQEDRILNVNNDTDEDNQNCDVENGNIRKDNEETSTVRQKTHFYKDHETNSVECFKHKIDKQGSHVNPFDQKRAVLTTHMKVSLKPESPSVGSEEKSSDICTDPCDFCGRMSRYMCKYCKYFYCKVCLEKLHPALGPFKSHKVIPTDGDIIIEYHDRCSDHGLVAQLYCSYCERKRCAECASTRCYLHFKGKVSEADIEREKAILVDELEKATSKLGFLETYKEKVEEELDNIEITGLLRREQIRQEFVSFHELLIQEECKMLQNLDKDMQERRDHVRDTLQTSVTALEKEDAVLSTTVTELVQSENAGQFIEDCVMAKDLCDQIDDTVRRFDRDWAKKSTYSESKILDNQFSMFIEKKQLLDKLELSADTEQQLRFKQNTLFLDGQSGPLEVGDYLQRSGVPTSTRICYIAQLLTGGKLIYETKTRDFRDITLNTENTIRLEAGNRYLLKVFPVYKCFISRVDQSDKQGIPTHMFIVTDHMFKAQPPNVNIGRLLDMTNHKKQVLRKHHNKQSCRKLRTVYLNAKKKFVAISKNHQNSIYRRDDIFKTYKTFDRESRDKQHHNENKRYKEGKTATTLRKAPRGKEFREKTFEKTAEKEGLKRQTFESATKKEVFKESTFKEATEKDGFQVSKLKEATENDSFKEHKFKKGVRKIRR